MTSDPSVAPVAQVGAHVAHWSEAVTAAAGLLVSSGAAVASYVDACLRVAHDHGAELVPHPGLAVVHAAPETGTRACGVAVLRLATPVPFGHERHDPVDVLMAYCSPDPEVHLSTAAALCSAVSDGLLDRVRAAADDTEVVAELTRALASSAGRRRPAG